MEYLFDELENADLVIDAIYKGGTAPNMSAEPFHKLIPRCENSGGFRKKTKRRRFRKICIHSIIYFNGRVGMAGLSG